MAALRARGGGRRSRRARRDRRRVRAADRVLLRRALPLRPLPRVPRRAARRGDRRRGHGRRASRGGLGLGGLTLVAAPVTLRWPSGARLELERASRCGPPGRSPGCAASPRCTSICARRRAASPAPSGPASRSPSQGACTTLALEQLPPELLAAAQGFALTGRLDADVDLSLAAGALGGRARARLRDGAFSAPGSPISIPFERLQAELDLGPGGAVRIESRIRSRGRWSRAPAQGRIGLAAWTRPSTSRSSSRWPTPIVRGMLAPLGVRLDGEGRASLRVHGIR